jgi:starch synthase
MYVVQVASELARVAKVGGLGDVVYGLSKQLVKEGHHVEIILPKYDCIQYGSLKNLTVDQKGIFIKENDHSIHNLIWSASLDNLKIILIEPDHPKDYFNRGIIYGAPDDAERFIYFSRVAFEYLSRMKKSIDALHLHDWHTALIPVLYQQFSRSLGARAGKTVFTIHNLEHQGKYNLSYFSPLNLKREILEDPHSPDLANLVKGAIITADVVTAVSPNYRKEILTPEGGFGLDQVLKKYESKLKGILNGIDPDFWNPKTDPHLVSHYSTEAPLTTEKMEHLLKAKKENQQRLKEHLGMNKDDHTILVASVTRLVFQKGPELIKHALFRTLERGGQFVLLGATSDPAIARDFINLKKEMENNKNVAISLDQNESLAHLIYAAADLLVLPSLFEPCGLTQLIAFRYGVIPVARMTGGLVDTVFDIDTSKRPEKERNGFTFDFPDKEGVNWALDRAITCYEKEPQKFQLIMRQGMREDFSWHKSAREYLDLYKRKNLWQRITARFTAPRKSADVEQSAARSAIAARQ